MPTYFILSETPKTPPKRKTKKQLAAERKRQEQNLRDLLNDHPEVGGQQPGTWPMRSLSMAVHPKDAKAANKLLEKAGLSARHDRTGKLVIPDRAEHKRILKYRSRPGLQMHDFDSFS